MVITILIIVPSALQSAYAAFPDCTGAEKSNLANGEIYVSAEDDKLYKVTGNTGEACLVGTIVDSNGAGVECDDIALDHSVDPAVLYCLGDGDSLWSVSRTPDATPEVLATQIGAGLMVVGASDPDCMVALCPIDFINAMEISSNGVAYAAATESVFNALDCADVGDDPVCNGGKLFTVDLTNAQLTLIAAFGDEFRSAGDLALDESANPDDMYWTVECKLLTAGANPEDGTCSSASNDALFRIDLEGPTLVFIKDLATPNIFALEHVDTGDPTLCYLTNQGDIFETDTSGTVLTGNFPAGSVKTQIFGTGPPLLSIVATGSTANFVGGSVIIIDKIALVLVGVETNAVWLILFMISAVGVVAYQFTGKTNNKKIKNS